MAVPRPVRGRVFAARRRVRLGDATPGGRLRLDAAVRYLQDVSNDDTRDAGLDESWVVRRTAIDVHRFPVVGEEVELETFCSGVGGRWADRRVSIAGRDGGSIEAASLWVRIDPGTGRPLPLSDRFFELYGEAAAGRTVRARLTHPDPDRCDGRHPWPTRLADFDVMGHMNNAAYWTVVDEELARRRDLRAPLRADVEFRAPIEPGAAVEVVHVDGADDVHLWLTGADATVFATAVVRRQP